MFAEKAWISWLMEVVRVIKKVLLGETFIIWIIWFSFFCGSLRSECFYDTCTRKQSRVGWLGDIWPTKLISNTYCSSFSSFPLMELFNSLLCSLFFFHQNFQNTHFLLFKPQIYCLNYYQIWNRPPKKQNHKKRFKTN